MKHITCDKCGKEKPISTVLSPTWEVKISSDDTEHVRVDLCDSCFNRLKRWVSTKDPVAA